MRSHRLQILDMSGLTGKVLTTPIGCKVGEVSSYQIFLLGLPQNNTYDLCVYMIPGTGDWV